MLAIQHSSQYGQCSQYSQCNQNGSQYRLTKLATVTVSIVPTTTNASDHTMNVSDNGTGCFYLTILTVHILLYRTYSTDYAD